MTWKWKCVIPAFREEEPESIMTTNSGRAESLMDKLPCVYIMTNRRRGTLYTGVTSDLPGRGWQHKNDLIEGFSQRYRLHTLAWYEVHESMLSAIQREKSIKHWRRQWKIELIERSNPDWRDLYLDLA